MNIGRRTRARPYRADCEIATSSFLKERLRDEHDFAKIAAFFHDEVVPLSSFAAENQLLKQMLTTLFEQKFPSDPMTRMRFLHVRSEGATAYTTSGPRGKA